MIPEDVFMAAQSSFGIAVGLFVGAMIGLSIRAKSGKTGGLYRNSVVATAFLLSMVGWAFSILLRLVAGSV